MVETHNDKAKNHSNKIVFSEGELRQTAIRVLKSGKTLDTVEFLEEEINLKSQVRIYLREIAGLLK